MAQINKLSLLTLFVLTACASYDHVRPGADGIHQVIIRGPDKENVETKAIREAKNFCQSKELEAAFISDKTDYTGSMNESTHKMIRKTSKAAMAGGAMLETLDDENDSKLGEGIFGAGAVGRVLQDEEAYTTKMKFKCL